jgi:hypothetical protein
MISPALRHRIPLPRSVTFEPFETSPSIRFVNVSLVHPTSGSLPVESGGKQLTDIESNSEVAMKYTSRGWSPDRETAVRRQSHNCITSRSPRHSVSNHVWHNLEQPERDAQHTGAGSTTRNGYNDLATMKLTTDSAENL